MLNCVYNDLQSKSYNGSCTRLLYTGAGISRQSYIQLCTYLWRRVFSYCSLQPAIRKFFVDWVTVNRRFCLCWCTNASRIKAAAGLIHAAGAAIATVAAQALSVVFALILLVKMKLPFTITKKDFRLNVQCKRFLQIGLPLALQECLTQISFLALCAFVNRLGLEASSGYGAPAGFMESADQP